MKKMFLFLVLSLTAISAFASYDERDEAPSYDAITCDMSLVSGSMDAPVVQAYKSEQYYEGYLMSFDINNSVVVYDTTGGASQGVIRIIDKAGKKSNQDIPMPLLQCKGNVIANDCLTATQMFKVEYNTVILSCNYQQVSF